MVAVSSDGNGALACEPCPEGVVAKSNGGQPHHLPRSCTVPLEASRVIFEGKQYATLSYSLVNGTNLTNQNYFLPVPGGCQLAPDTALIRDKVVSAYRWNTQYLILESGNGVRTSFHGAADGPQDMMRMMWEKRNGHYRTYTYDPDGPEFYAQFLVECADIDGDGLFNDRDSDDDGDGVPDDRDPFPMDPNKGGDDSGEESINGR